MKNQISIPGSVLLFLKDLAAHNEREWFNANKDRYLEAYGHMSSFAGALHEQMSRHDELDPATGKQVLYRIYADTRFSKEKKPYKTHWGGRFSRATAKRRGGYYFHIAPGNSFAAGGFFGPNAADLQRIRQDIDLNYVDWRGILSEKTFKKTFGSLRGEQLQTAPRGFEKNHPAVDLLRYKQFLLRHDFSDKEVLAGNFISQLDDTFRQMRPFLDYMSEVLTTDGNGEPLV